MPTGSPFFPSTQPDSHWSSTGQTRPVIAGSALSLRTSAAASANFPARMRSITPLTSTDTGHFSMHPGFGHSMQRRPSCRACSAGNPRLTSRKLCARTCASCSGTLCRGSFTRSLFGSGLFLGFAGVASLIGHPRHHQRTLSLMIPATQAVQLGLRIGLQALDALALLLAVHAVALHQYLEVDSRCFELGTVDTGELA